MPVLTGDAFRSHKTWLHITLQPLQAAKPRNNKQQKPSLPPCLHGSRSRLCLFERGLSQWQETSESAKQKNSIQVHTTACFPPIDLTTSSAKCFQPVYTSNPLVAIAMFLVVALNLFRGLMWPGCNFALQILQVLVQCTLE
jgi:hypothetical protein